MSGGRSAACIVEELLAYPAGDSGFTHEPIDVQHINEPAEPVFAVVPISTWPSRALSAQSDDATDTREILATFKSSRHIISAKYKPHGTQEPDFHINSRLIENGVIGADYLCPNTGSTLTIRVYPPQIKAGDWKMFDFERIVERHRCSPHDEDDVLPPRILCIFTLYRILKDYVFDPQPHDINLNSRIVNRIDIDYLLRLGFLNDTQHRKLKPPPKNPDTCAYFHRLVIELATELLIEDQNYQGLVLEPALPLFYDMMGVPPSNRSPDRIPARSPRPYLLLGATDTFSDDTLIERYEIQTLNDFHNTPFYLEALREIAQLRNSEKIEMRVMELASMGVKTSVEVEKAFAEFGLDMNDEVDDETIIENYAQAIQTWLEHSTRLTKSLEIIADFRDSPRLRRVAAITSMESDECFALLELPQSASDEEIIERATQRIQTDFQGILEAGQCLVRIGLSRKSSALLNFFEVTFRNSIAADASASYNALGISESMDDRDVITAFTIASGDNDSNLLEYRQMLRAIGKDRGSELIMSFLASGKMDEEDKTMHPVGLWNIGSTCYLNSILQMCYTLLPMREMALHFDEGGMSQPLDESLNSKKVGGRLVPLAEVLRSQKFVRKLGSLFNEMMTTDKDWVQPTEELAYMALMPPQEDVEETAGLKDQIDAAQTPSPIHMVSPSDESESESVSDEDMKDMEVPDRYVHRSNAAVRLHMALQRHQDVTECIENILFQFEAAVRATSNDEDGEQIDFVKDLFFGEMIQTLQPMDPSTGTPRKKRERFSSIMVDVSEGPTTIYDALAKFFSSDIVTLSEGDTLRTVQATKFPPVLLLHIQRVQFDRETYQVFKSLNALLFERVIYLDRYLETDDITLQSKVQEMTILQKELKAATSKLAELQKKMDNGLTRVQNMVQCVNWLRKKNIPIQIKTLLAIESTCEHLRLQERELIEKVEQLKHQTETQFDDYKKHGYHIHSLFIHRGQASFGHYWIYIRDWKTGQYWQFNDEIVTPVSEEVVFDTSEGNTATPYFLVFVREGFDGVSSVLRNVSHNQERHEVLSKDPEILISVDSSSSDTGDEQNIGEKEDVLIDIMDESSPIPAAQIDINPGSGFDKNGVELLTRKAAIPGMNSGKLSDSAVSLQETEDVDVTVDSDEDVHVNAMTKVPTTGEQEPLEYKQHNHPEEGVNEVNDVLQAKIVSASASHNNPFGKMLSLKNKNPFVQSSPYQAENALAKSTSPHELLVLPSKPNEGQNLISLDEQPKVETQQLVADADNIVHSAASGTSLGSPTSSSGSRKNPFKIVAVDDKL